LILRPRCKTSEGLVSGEPDGEVSTAGDYGADDAGPFNPACAQRADQLLRVLSGQGNEKAT
jgi:hypothetical protein